MCYIVFEKLLCGRANRGFYEVVLGLPDDEKLPEKVYAAFLQVNLFNFIKVNRVVVVDFGVSEKIKDDCVSIFSNPKNVVFIEKDDFERMADKIENNLT